MSRDCKPANTENPSARNKVQNPPKFQQNFGKKRTHLAISNNNDQKCVIAGFYCIFRSQLRSHQAAEYFIAELIPISDRWERLRRENELLNTTTDKMDTDDDEDDDDDDDDNGDQAGDCRDD